jgi:hypothetical protein
MIVSARRAVSRLPLRPALAEEHTSAVRKEEETRTTGCIRQINHKGPHMDENEFFWAQ